MSSASAYLLVFHGSRDPRPQQAVERLSQLVMRRLQERQQSAGGWPEPAIERSDWSHTAPLVGTACLELGPAPLHQQVVQFARQVWQSGCPQIQVVPLFLLPGVHVKEDIPAELAIAQPLLPSVTLHLRPHLGSHPDVKRLLPVPSSEAAVILLSHGSRRPQGNEPVERLAQQLQTWPAYWSVQPSLEDQVRLLAAQGYGQIKIIPYFLFPGGILDAIALQLTHLTQQFPGVEFQLTEPIGPSPALAELVVDLTTDLTPRVPSSVTYDS